MNDLRNLNNENTDSKRFIGALIFLSTFSMFKACSNNVLWTCSKHLITDPTGMYLVSQWIRLCTPSDMGAQVQSPWSRN